MRRYAHLSILPLSIHAPRRGSDCTRAMSPVFWNTRQEWTIFSNASSLLDCGLTKSRHPLFFLWKTSFIIVLFYIYFLFFAIRLHAKTGRSARNIGAIAT